MQEAMVVTKHFWDNLLRVSGVEQKQKNINYNENER